MGASVTNTIHCDVIVFLWLVGRPTLRLSSINHPIIGDNWGSIWFLSFQGATTKRNSLSHISVNNHTQTMPQVGLPKFSTTWKQFFGKFDGWWGRRRLQQSWPWTSGLAAWLGRGRLYITRMNLNTFNFDCIFSRLSAIFLSFAVCLPTSSY